MVLVRDVFNGICYTDRAAPRRAEEACLIEEELTFSTREKFRAWLRAHGEAGGGVWLVFGKPGGRKTLKASEALEEALCFGWIDGRMQRIDDASYRKYFAPRRAKSVWSDKNKALAVELEERGLMTDAGRRAMEAAKRNGCWDAKKAPDVTEDDTAALEALIAGHEPAASNFQAMSPSVRRTYTRAYFDAKTDAGREKRLAWMLDRLDRNLKPM